MGRFNTGGRKSSLWIYAVPTSATSTRLIINSGTDGQPNLPWRRRLMRALQPRCRPALVRAHMQIALKVLLAAPLEVPGFVYCWLDHGTRLPAC